MPIESSVSSPSDLNASYPENGDVKSFGAQHIRNVKTAVRYLISTLTSTDLLGFATGAGGTVTQLTSYSTGVTVNKTCGAITLVAGGNLSAGSLATFTVTNSKVAATDLVIASWKSDMSGTELSRVRIACHAYASGSFKISLVNEASSDMALSSKVINFAVIKGVTS